jgi:hypothetical protein
MSAEAVAEALMSMHEDDRLRRDVDFGRLEALEALELTPDELELVRGAAEELPDGDPRKVLVARGAEAEVEAMSALTPGANAGYRPPGQAQAIDYVRRNLRDPDVQARFGVFMAVGDDVVP